MFKIELTKEVLKSYLDILPISYYLGAKLYVGITDYESSYYNFKTNQIMISLPQINLLAYKEKPSDDILERDIRTMLYHEVSHGLLTCRCETKINHTILNVFEDERIETLLDSYYLDTDFKSFIKRINNFDPKTNPKNEFEYFYRVVRFRFGEQNLVDRVSMIIHDARFLNATTTCGENHYSFSDYQDDVEKLYNDCTEYFESHYERVEEVNLDEEEIILKITFDKNKANERINIDINDLKGKKVTILIDSKEALNCIKDNMPGLISNQEFNRTDDAIMGSAKLDFKSRIKQLIESYKSRSLVNHQNRGKQLTAYSGRLTPRLTINNDYRWWIRENMGEQSGKTNKLHLNLFVDTSASFTKNEGKTNAILKELDNLEKEISEKFSYTLITMSRVIEIANDNNRRIRCSGGTYLDSSWNEVFLKTQKNDCKCINIVLFDGMCYSESNKNVFSTFNTTNTILISDYGNMDPINLFCTKAKKRIIIYDGSYVDKLEDNVIDALESLIR